MVSGPLVIQCIPQSGDFCYIICDNVIQFRNDGCHGAQLFATWMEAKKQEARKLSSNVSHMRRIQSAKSSSLQEV